MEVDKMITLYRTKLSPERNALVDDIAQYLNTCESERIECQYIKNGLDIEIKLDLPQDILSHPVYNYAAIQNENDSLVYYYFIMDAKWVAKSTVRLVLSIDSVNTFRDRLEWSEKTNVLREHRDRMVVSAGANHGRRIIDEVDEGIVPLQLLSEDRKILEHDKDINWYLMYRTRRDLSPTDITNPIDCYTFASKSLELEVPGSTADDVIIAAGDLNKNYYYYAVQADNTQGKATTDSETITFNTTTNYGIVFWVFGDSIKYKKITKIGANDLSYASESITPVISFSKVKEARISDVALIGHLGILLSLKTFNIEAGVAYSTIQGIQELDRTDSRIMKIIELPYAPFNINYNSATNKWYIPEGWEWSDGMLKLQNLNTEFQNSVLALYLYEFTCDLPYATGDVRLLEVPHNISRESKLYNSNFYTYKLAYDNFYAQVAFERFKNLQTATPTLKIEFKPTNTINSNLIFKWDVSGADYKKIADYENFIPCNRNNEISIFSNDYVNYIRTGYNYDKKIKIASDVQRSGGGALTAGSAIGRAIIAGALTGGGAGALLAGAGSVLGTALSSITSQIEADASFNSKLNQLAAQSSAVSGSDDVDLLNYYNGNKLHAVTYQPTDRMRESLYDLFRYTGYATNVQKLPDLNSRCRYNFIQCEAKFLNEDEDVLKPYVDDIKSRYAAGVTVYHNVDFTWDWDQVYENWENSIIYPFN